MIRQLHGAACRTESEKMRYPSEVNADVTIAARNGYSFISGLNCSTNRPPEDSDSISQISVREDRQSHSARLAPPVRKHELDTMHSIE